MQYFSDDWFRSEWRNLGFYYALNHEARRWEITGPLKGLKAFSFASPYDLQLNLMVPQFDPASCDDLLATPDGQPR